MMLSGRLIEYARQCVRDGVFGVLQEAVLSKFAYEITALEAIAGDKVILNEQCAALEARIEALVEATNKQAEDESLWFQAETAPEARLQQALRYLHALIEGDELMAALAAKEET